MFRARLGIRGRILAIALVPSLTLLVVGVTVAGYLVTQGTHAKDWATAMQQVVDPTAEMMRSIAEERRLSLAAIAGDNAAAAQLGPARLRVNNALLGANESSMPLQELDSREIEATFDGTQVIVQQVAQMRNGVDTRTAPGPEVYAFYNAFIGNVAAGAQLAQRTAPGAEVANRLAGALRIANAIEAMQRSHALSVATISGNSDLMVPMSEFRRDVGFYHAEIGNLGRTLDKPQRERIAGITSSAGWQRLSGMEEAIIQRYARDAGETADVAEVNDYTTYSTSGASSDEEPLPMALPEWRAAATEVTDDLIGLWVAQSLHAHRLAEQNGSQATANSLFGGAAVFLLSVAAFLVALVVANRVIRRLKRLRKETLALADEHLPVLMDRLRAGDNIDLAVESPTLDYGRDEIGQVAKAFEQAHAAAISAAVAEARTREGVKAVFLNIAHRSQIVVHRQLEILDKAEHRQEDPALLETLFKLDHLATRERRNAENLVILGGGAPGRQWRNPVALIDLVRSAVGETLDYQRIRVARLPDERVVGGVVADIIHLLAELADNATAFSPPQSRVEVTGNIVGKGIVVEVSDQGMGMPTETLEQMNEMLVTPPDFGVAALSADSRLGLFVVAQLAARHAVSVRLAESDYGGIRAIVLIPSALLATDVSNTAATTTQSELPGPLSQRRSLLTSAVAPHDSDGQDGRAPGDTLVADPPAPTNDALVKTDVPPESTATNAASDDAAQPIGADGRPILPRRSRQTNLAPELAQPTMPTQAEQTPPRPRSAEQARDMMSAIENGTKQGRKPVADPANEQQQEGWS